MIFIEESEFLKAFLCHRKRYCHQYAGGIGYNACHYPYGGSVEYGQLSIFTLYATIAVMVLCLGLDQALVRFYYESDTLEYRRALLFKELCRNNSYNSLAEIRVQTVFFSRK